MNVLLVFPLCFFLIISFHSFWCTTSQFLDLWFENQNSDNEKEEFWSFFGLDQRSIHLWFEWVFFSFSVFLVVTFTMAKLPKVDGFCFVLFFIYYAKQQQRNKTSKVIIIMGSKFFDFCFCLSISTQPPLLLFVSLYNPFG